MKRSKVDDDEEYQDEEEGEEESSSEEDEEHSSGEAEDVKLSNPPPAKKKRASSPPAVVYRGLRPGELFNSGVISDLITRVKGEFLANGLDSRVLAEMRDRWEQRIQQLKGDEKQRLLQAAAKEEQEIAKLLSGSSTAAVSGASASKVKSEEEDDDDRLDNSDLGSADDIDQVVNIETNNVILCQVSSHKRSKSTRGGTSVYRRRITLEKGMVTIKGDSYVFKELQGEFAEK